MDIGEVFKWGFIVVNTAALALGAYNDRSWIRAYRDMHWLLLLVQILSLPIILPLITGLATIHPIMGLSWLNLFGKVGSNVALLGWDIKYVGVIVLFFMFLNLPFLAKWEEGIFRAGTKNWADAIGRSIAFGSVHMLFGVPLYGAIVIAGFGMFYSLMFFIGGVELSTKAHFQYNFLLVTLLFIIVVLQLFV